MSKDIRIKNAKESLKTLSDHLRIVLDFKNMQKDLMERMKDDLKRFNSLNSYAVYLDVPRTSLVNFAEGFPVTTIMRKLMEKHEVESIWESKLKSFEEMPKKYIGFSLMSDDVINCMFDINELYYQNAHNFSPRQFAMLFPGNETLIRNILGWKNEAAFELNKNNKAEEFLYILTDDAFPEKIAALQQEITGHYKRQVIKLADIFGELDDFFPFRKDVFSAMKVHRSDYDHAMSGKLEDHILDDLVEKAERLLATKKAEPEETSKEVVRTDNPKPQEEKDAIAPEKTTVDGLKGATSARGVRFTLNRENFVEIDFEPNADLIRFAKQSFESTRAILNILAQIKNEELRQKAMKELGPEIEELFLAIKIATFAIPNNVLEIYQAQRETWESLKKPRKEKK